MRSEREVGYLTSGRAPSAENVALQLARLHGRAAERRHLSIIAEYAIGGATIYRWAAEQRFTVDREHLVEPTARTTKHLQRVAALREESSIDPTRLEVILRRYNLELPW